MVRVWVWLVRCVGVAVCGVLVCGVFGGGVALAGGLAPEPGWMCLGISGRLICRRVGRVG